MTQPRDHGGGIDAAIEIHGGRRADWLDLSTGINPVPFSTNVSVHDAWTALPDQNAVDALIRAARQFWNVPDSAQIIPVPGASAAIARMPDLVSGQGAYVPTPTYNEHAAAFAARDMLGVQSDTQHPTHIYVHPNNPDGRMWGDDIFAQRPLTIVDESFCDVCPQASHIARTTDTGVIVLKSFGKFWGLAGLRLGFVIGQADTLKSGHTNFKDLIGPWAVSGPALSIGTGALNDDVWAQNTRTRLKTDATTLDTIMNSTGAETIGGTDLFRLYSVPDAKAFQNRLAKSHIWSRIFPYSDTFIRLGLPAPDQFDRLKDALT